MREIRAAVQNHYKFIVVRRMLLVGFFYEFSILALLLLFPLFILVIIRRRRALLSPVSRQQLPPSPPKLPIIGNLHQIGPLPHHSLRALSDKHGSLMLLHLGRVPTLVASSADAACEIMKTHDLIFANRPLSMVLRVLLSGSMDMVFAPYGEYYRHVRKLFVTHILSARMVESFQRMREEEVDFMIESISSRASSSHTSAVVDMSEVLYSFANDTTCRVVSGKFSIKEGRNSIFRELIEESSVLVGKFHVGDYVPSLAWMDVFFGLGARAKTNAKKWKEVLDEVIKEHADRSRGSENNDNDFVDVLLSLLREPNKDFALNDGHMRALLQDVFGGGTDTPYIILDWAMAELVRNQEAMKKLQDEVRGIANGRAKIREEDLSENSYLKAVVKEVMRLHPPLPLLFPRVSTQDCQIGVYKVPKQTRVIINAWAIARDPRFWESPEEFWPERFINNPTDFKGNDFHFIPFGAGRRICPGMKFATSLMELALANLIHQFDWELPDGITGENLDMDDAPGITTRRKQRLYLNAKPYSPQKIDL